MTKYDYSLINYFFYYHAINDDYADKCLSETSRSPWMLHGSVHWGLDYHMMELWSDIFRLSVRFLCQYRHQKTPKMRNTILWKPHHHYLTEYWRSSTIHPPHLDLYKFAYQENTSLPKAITFTITVSRTVLSSIELYIFVHGHVTQRFCQSEPRCNY